MNFGGLQVQQAYIPVQMDAYQTLCDSTRNSTYMMQPVYYAYDNPQYVYQSGQFTKMTNNQPAI